MSDDERIFFSRGWMGFVFYFLFLLFFFWRWDMDLLFLFLSLLLPTLRITRWCVLMNRWECVFRFPPGPVPRYASSASGGTDADPVFSLSLRR